MGFAHLFDDELSMLIELTCSSAAVARTTDTLVAQSGIRLVGNPPTDPEREYARAIQTGIRVMLESGYTPWQIKEAFNEREKEAQLYATAALDLKKR